MISIMKKSNRLPSHVMMLLFVVMYLTASSNVMFATAKQITGIIQMNVTCSGNFDFSKITVKDGIVAARVLKLSYMSTVYGFGGHEALRKLSYVGVIDSVAQFNGTWYREDYGDEGWFGTIPTPRDTGNDDVAVDVPTPNADAIKEAVAALTRSMENLFVMELRKTRRTAFKNVDTCMIQYKRFGN